MGELMNPNQLRKRNVKTDIGAVRAINFQTGDAPRWNATTGMFEPFTAALDPVDYQAMALTLADYVRYDEMPASVDMPAALAPYVKTVDMQTALGNYATSQALSNGLGAKVNSGTFTSHVNLQGAHGSLTVANTLAEFVTNEQKAAARASLGLGGAATMNTGLTGTTVALGDHNHDTRYVKKPTTTPIVLNLLSEAGMAIPGILTLLALPDLLVILDGRVKNLEKEMNKHRIIEREGGAAT
jgi:hypothetical protein